MSSDRYTPTEGHVEMRSGCYLYWKTSADHGGRIYSSDEIPCGVAVWDTACVHMSTLLEAIAVEQSLQAMERRAREQEP